MDPPDEGQFWRNQAEKTRNERKRLAADASGLSELQRLRTHARSGDRIALAAYLGEDDLFDRAIASFAADYADTNEQDYSLLRDAVDSGRLPGARGR